MPGDPKAVAAAYVALWSSAEDQVGLVDLTALAGNPRTSMDEATAQAIADANMPRTTFVAVMAKKIDAILAAPPPQGPDCYLLTELRKAFPKYEAGWEKRIEAYGKAMGWTGVDLEDPSAPAPAPAPTPAATAAAPAAVVQPAPAAQPAPVVALPGLGGAPRGPSTPPPQLTQPQGGGRPEREQKGDRDDRKGGDRHGKKDDDERKPREEYRPVVILDPRISEILARPNVNMCLTAVVAAFDRGDLAQVAQTRANLEMAHVEGVVGSDGAKLLKEYIDARRNGMPLTDLHPRFGLPIPAPAAKT
jgi:hypothetical protein